MAGGAESVVSGSSVPVSASGRLGVREGRRGRRSEVVLRSPHRLRTGTRSRVSALKSPELVASHPPPPGG